MIGALLTAAYRLSMLKRLVESAWVQDRLMYLRVLYDSQTPTVKRLVTAGLVVLLLVVLLLVVLFA